MMDDDRISDLLDEILSSILSRLPTKVVVSTSVISKRWKHQWRSVPTLDFEDSLFNKTTYFGFVHSVNAYIVSRDSHQPLQRFSLRCQSSLCDLTNTYVWINTAVERRVEHLDLSLSWKTHLPSSVFNCKTLVVLMLAKLHVITPSSVDLPSLRILHLNFVQFKEHADLARLLCGCVNLEDLSVEYVQYGCDLPRGYKKVEEPEFKRLPKLVRAHIENVMPPFQVVDNVEFLCIDWKPNRMRIRMEPLGQLSEFHNLTHIEYGYLENPSKWSMVLEVLEHCHNLQVLVIDKKNHGPLFNQGANWPYPRSVPKCISLHLKACCLKNYRGSKCEFQFARYIMQNATFLQTMTICIDTTSDQQENNKIREELSLWMRHSATCDLSFK